MTWTLSGFGDEIDPDPVVQLSVLRALGARHIEVRSAWGVNIVDLDDGQLDRLGKLITERGMAVSAIASPIGKVDIDGDPDAELHRLRRAIAAAHRLGSAVPAASSRSTGAPTRRPRRSGDAVLRRMAGFAALAEAERVVLLHENEKDIYGDIPDRVLDLIESVGSRRAAGGLGQRQLRPGRRAPVHRRLPLLRPYLEYLQVKDAIAGTGAVVPAGEGDGELLATLTALRDDGYAGFASLEPHLADSARPRRLLRPGRVRARRPGLRRPHRARSECRPHDGGTTGPADPIPVAIVGGGIIGANHAAAILRHPRLRIAAIVDANPAAAAALAQRVAAAGPAGSRPVRDPRGGAG